VKRINRLTSSKDIQRVRRSGRSYAHPLLLLIVESSSQSEPFKAAFLASKKIGSAVERNKAKRWMRSAFEPYKYSIMASKKLLFIARNGILKRSYQETESAIASVLERASVKKENDATNRDPA